jgi:hypothetical protein
LETKAGLEGDTVASVWLVGALEYARVRGQSKLVDYLETIADDVAFEAEMAARRASLLSMRSSSMFVPVLSDGYQIERGGDVLTLLRADGTVVARFSARGVVCEEIERAATEDALSEPRQHLRSVPVRHVRKNPVLPRHD